MPPERIAGIVLAAGLSSRMGTNKMLLRIGGTSLLRRTIGTALAARLDPLLVVLGHESERALAEISGLPVTPVQNPEYAEGMNTSLRAGARALPDDVAGAVVLLGDMPLVDTQMIVALTEAFVRDHPPLVVSVYGEVVAPPILYGRSLFAELRALEADACGKRVVKQHRAQAAELRWPPERLTDLDAPDDLRRLREQLEVA